MRVSSALAFACFLVAALDCIDLTAAVPSYGAYQAPAPAPIPSPTPAYNVQPPKSSPSYTPSNPSPTPAYSVQPPKSSPTYTPSNPSPSYPGGVNHGKDDDDKKYNNSKPAQKYTAPASDNDKHYRKPVTTNRGGKDDYAGKSDEKSHGSKSHHGKSGNGGHRSKSVYGGAKPKDCDKKLPHPAYIAKRGYSDYAPTPAPATPVYSDGPASNGGYKQHRHPVSMDKGKKHDNKHGSKSSHYSKSASGSVPHAKNYGVKAPAPTPTPYVPPTHPAY